MAPATCLQSSPRLLQSQSPSQTAQQRCGSSTSTALNSNTSAPDCRGYAWQAGSRPCIKRGLYHSFEELAMW
jgi:hypothetical protein